MRATKALAIAAFATLAATSIASATDLVDVVPPAPVYGPADSGFDWSGIYFGKFVYQNIFPDGDFGYQGIVKAIGVNLELGDHFLIGGEVRASANFFEFTYDSYTISALARGGFVLGENFLIYGIGGITYSDLGGGSNVTESVIGGGVEVAVGDSLALRGEVTHRDCIAGNVPCLVGGYNQFLAGLTWHFN